MTTLATHVWRPSSARVVVLDGFVPVARGATPTAPAPLSWPIKDPADVLDYQFDATAVLLGNEGDGIVSLDVTIAPAETAGLGLISAVADGACAVLWFSGGVAGRTYTVTLSILTESGRSITRDLLLPVLQLSTPATVGALLVGSTPLTDQVGIPLTTS